MSSGLLALRLSPQDFQQYAAARKPRYPFRKEDEPVDPAKVQAVVVRGFNADAVAAIKAAVGAEEGVLRLSYVLGRDLYTVIEQVEDKVMIKRKNWRLNPRGEAILTPKDTLRDAYMGKLTERPIELVLIPEAALAQYLSSNELLSAWKKFRPIPYPDTNGSTPRDKDVLAFAHVHSAFHLLDPAPSPYWGSYLAHRQDAEWTFARMRYRENGGSEFLAKVKDGVECVLEDAALGPTERQAIADGILLQGLEVWEDSWGSYLNDVTAFTRVWSPCRPALVEVFLHCPAQCNLTILYRIHDPVPSDEALAKVPHIRSIEDRPAAGKRGWRKLFSIELVDVPRTKSRKGGYREVERNVWGFRARDAEALQAALFGGTAMAEKMTKVEAARLVMASVGFAFDLRKGEGQFDRDKLGGNVDSCDWRIGRLDWIGANLRIACGVPLFPRDAERLQLPVDEETEDEWDDDDDDDDDDYDDEEDREEDR